MLYTVLTLVLFTCAPPWGSFINTILSCNIFLFWRSAGPTVGFELN